MIPEWLQDRIGRWSALALRCSNGKLYSAVGCLSVEATKTVVSGVPLFFPKLDSFFFLFFFLWKEEISFVMDSSQWLEPPGQHHRPCSLCPAAVQGRSGHAISVPTPLLSQDCAASLSFLDLDLDLYFAGTIFGHFCNGTGRAQCRYIKKKVLKKNSLCGFTVPILSI